MGRFSYDEADNYGSNGSGSSFFQLKNDKDVARVRYMYNSAKDIEGYAVHKVTVGDKERYVNCLRSYNETKEKCPFCASGVAQRAKIYVPLYDVDAEEVKIWERGKNYIPQLTSICARYATAEKPLVSHIFEIERNGKPKDTNTTYISYEVGCDETRLEDLPELPTVLGTIILDKSADEMQEFLETGRFPNTDGAPTRRATAPADEPISRRTPMSRRGGSEEF